MIASDTRLIEEEAVNILTRENLFGEKIQIHRGEGSEFDSLREFQAGMDSRAIDWKQTARHRTLLTREFRTEKNHSIIFAIDTGRLMSEPVRGGLSRLDHALNAALLMSFISLRLGDRVGFFAFGRAPPAEDRRRFRPARLRAVAQADGGGSITPTRKRISPLA